MALSWVDRGPVHLIAHRGASAYAPANSVEAVQAAARVGATDVEVDVHTTADGTFVVVHDSLAGDSSNQWISTLTIEEYASGLARHGKHVTHLDDIMQTASDCNLGLYLDIKQILPGTEKLLGEKIRAAGFHDTAVLASFRSDLATSLKHVTGLLTAVLFYDPDTDLNSLVRATGCDFVHPCFDAFKYPMHLFTSAWLARARTTKAGVVTWNTTDQKTAADVLQLGVDGICADDPAILTAALKSISA